MANIYKNEKTSLTNTDLTTLYTVPSNSRAIVKSLLIAEDAAGSAVIKVTFVGDSLEYFVPIDTDNVDYQIVQQWAARDGNNIADAY